MIQPSIGIQRLHNQRVIGAKCATADAVVKQLGAMQAQDYRQALWAIGVRMQAATVADVEAAIAAARIVRTWSQRGTIHFVPAEDTHWMLALCATPMIARHEYRMQQLALDLDVIARCEALAVTALRGGNCLTRAALFALFERAGIATAQQRGYHILWHLAGTGVICMGPNQDNAQSFVLLDEWVPQPVRLTLAEALTELVWRFFAGHGPAMEADFTRWSGLTPAETRSGLHNNRHRLRSLQIDRTTYWVSETETHPASPDRSGCVLLPAFDEYLLGYRDRSAVLAAEHAARVVPGNNGVFQPLIVVDGQVVGTWKRVQKRNALEITLHPFTGLGTAEQLAITAAQTFADFAQLPLKSVTVAAH